MIYYFLAINFNTLCRSIRFIDTKKLKDDATIIYLRIDTSVPRQILNDYDIVEINGYGIEKFHGIKKNFFEILAAKNTSKIVKGMIKNINSECVFVVFRDNEPVETTIISSLSSMKNKKIHFWIIEEGIGIYSTRRSPIKLRKIKKFVYFLTGISLYSLTSNPQGLNTHIEKIVCGNPNSLVGKVDLHKVKTEKMMDVFTDEFCMYFASAVLEQKKIQVYDFVFLTIPILDLSTDRFDLEIDEYMKRVKAIIKTLEVYGSVLIKLHPRDRLDYSNFENNKIHVCSALENKVPYECLSAYYGNPKMISAFSSASIGSKNKKRSFYISDILGIKDGGSGLPDKFYEDNNIIICRTLEELRTNILSEMEQL